MRIHLPRRGPVHDHVHHHKRLQHFDIPIRENLPFVEQLAAPLRIDIFQQLIARQQLSHLNQNHTITFLP